MPIDISCQNQYLTNGCTSFLPSLLLHLQSNNQYTSITFIAVFILFCLILHNNSALLVTLHFVIIYLSHLHTCEESVMDRDQRFPMVLMWPRDFSGSRSQVIKSTVHAPHPCIPIFYSIYSVFVIIIVVVAVIIITITVIIITISRVSKQNILTGVYVYNRSDKHLESSTKMFYFVGALTGSTAHVLHTLTLTLISAVFSALPHSVEVKGSPETDRERQTDRQTDR